MSFILSNSDTRFVPVNETMSTLYTVCCDTSTEQDIREWGRLGF